MSKKSKKAKTHKPHHEPANSKGPEGHSTQNDLGVLASDPALPQTAVRTDKPDHRAAESVVWKWVARIGILAGIGYAIVTFYMWRAMLDSNKLSQKTFEVSQQASVTLGRKDGLVAEFRNSHNPKSQDGLVIYFQNSGHMPAKLNWGIGQWFTENPPAQLPGTTNFRPMMRIRNKKTGAISEDGSTDGSIGGDAVREVAVGYLPPGFVDYLSKTNKVFRVNGTYEYCDELGRYACRDFSLAYQQLPFGTFRIMRNQGCIDRAWLGNTQPGPDEEVLPVCVPRNAPSFPNR